MKYILNILKKENCVTVIMCVKVAIMLLLLYLYLMCADISTTPKFIYNQF